MSARLSARDLMVARLRMAKRLLRSRLPEAIAARTGPPSARFDPKAVPPPVVAPTAAVRLLIGPRNFARQGYEWARAAERLPDVGAVSMQSGDNGGLAFPVDYAVADPIYTNSRRWGVRQRDAVTTGFTHVLIEATSSLFGAASDKVVAREVQWLRAAGVRVGMICHGTDIRLPSRHATLDEWSPFRDLRADWVVKLENRARFNQQILDKLDAPVFVSTPEMLLDRPGATWLPVVIHPERWATDAAVLDRAVPIVLHAPTNPLVKGTALIEPVVEALDRERLVSYRRVLRVPSADMPALYAGADVVLEQFALGMYSVTAVEAMAAGRLVIGHVHDQVRDHVREVTGLEVPVVEATPATLEAVLRDVASRREHYRAIAAQGPAFVSSAHDGTLSAQVLSKFLGVKLA